MLKFEWPLILPEDDDVKLLAEATFDLSEYVVDMRARSGPRARAEPVATGGVALHHCLSCAGPEHGPEGGRDAAAHPRAPICKVIERCSGHGGSWGYKTENFETALKVGAPVARQVAEGVRGVVSTIVTSECPLAGLHIKQGVQNQDGAEKLDGEDKPELLSHPIQLIAKAYGLEP